MGKMRKTFAQLEGLAEDTAKRRDVAEAAQRKTRIDKTVQAALLHAIEPDGIVEYDDPALIPIPDDGLAPAVAQNIDTRPIIEGIAVSWNTPDPTDRVKAANVRITPPGTTMRANALTGHTFVGLTGGVDYEIEVELIDAWGASSGWSAPVTETATTSAQTDIDLTEMAILGKLTGLLPNANLATIEDATKLGQGVVTAEAMVAGTAAFMDVWMDDAAINSAKIANLKADKITGGTIDTTDIFVASTMELAAGGELVAGEGTRLDSSGLKLLWATLFNEPAVNRDQRISPMNILGQAEDWGAISFYDDARSGVNRRGTVIRSDGDPGVRRGAVSLHATKAGDLASERSARVELLATDSGSGRVDIYNYLDVRGEMEASNYYLKSGGNLKSIKDTADSALSRAQASIRDASNTVGRGNLSVNVIAWDQVVVRKRDGVLVSKNR